MCDIAGGPLSILRAYPLRLSAARQFPSGGPHAAIRKFLDAVANKKYMSAPSEWASPGWDCIKFQMTTPQHFQYQWVLSSPTEGTVRAQCDLDGDHRPDVTFEVPVTCSASPSWACQVGTLNEIR